MANEKPEEVRIIDKRRFTSDGEIRKEGEVLSSDFSAPQQASQNQATEAKVQSERRQAPPATTDTDEPIDFSSFIVSIATQAMAALGEIPNPQTGVQAPNHAAARELIDIIAMLDLKTKGNLSADEALLIEEVLHSLRLAFVKRFTK